MWRLSLRLSPRQQPCLLGEAITKFALDVLRGLLRRPKYATPRLHGLGGGFFALHALLLPCKTAFQLFGGLSRAVDICQHASLLAGMHRRTRCPSKKRVL